MRKYYLDNIRWGVIVLVLVFHVVSIYCSCGAVMSYNSPGIPAMDTIGYLIYPWFMPLLFVVSGICARFSLSKKSNREYIRERTWRLLVPFISYLIFIGPFASGLSFRVNHMEEVFAALPAPIIFCIRIVNGMGPSWFLLQLFVLSLVFVPFRKMDKKDRLLKWGEQCGVPVLLLLYLPVLGAAQLLYIAYTFRIGLYLLLFLLGYYVFSHDRVQQSLQKHCIPLLAAGLAAGAAQTAVSWGKPYQAVVNDWLVMLYTWLMILALLGAAGRWWNRSTRFTSRMSSYSFSIYYFHYVPMIYAAWFLSEKLALPYIMNYILTFVFSLAAAVLLGKLFVRIPVLNVLFGLKKKDKKRDKKKDKKKDKKNMVPVDAPGK